MGSDQSIQDIQADIGMSIALATKGRLYPARGRLVIREQFSDISVNIEDPILITMEMVDVSTIEAVVSSEGLSVEIQLMDSVTGDIIETDIAGETEGCW